MTNADTDLIQEIIESGWRTSELVEFVLTWPTTSPQILAGTARSQPVWQCAVASTLDDARAFYTELAETDPEDLRWNAAEALVAGGCTLRVINRRKS